MNIKRCVVWPLVMVLSIGPCFGAMGNEEDEEYKALLEKAENKEAGDYVDGSLLTHEDFYIYTTEADDHNYPFNEYNYNILDALYADDSIYFFASASIDDYVADELGLGSDGINITYRGIPISSEESSKEDVIKKYGVGVQGRFDQTTDRIYEFLPDSLWQDLMKDNACSYLLYNFKDLGQIKFYFNSDNMLFMIAYIEGLYIDAEPPCVKQVQRYLNQNGYDLGKADGKLGPKTAAAIASYRESHGLSVNERIDDELMKCIHAEEEATEKAEKDNVSDRIKKENVPASLAAESEATDTAAQETEESHAETEQRSPYREDVPYEELMRNPYDHSSELYTFSGTVLQTFESYKMRLALNGNPDEQVICTYGWLQMPVDLLEGDTVTIYGVFEGKEKYTNVLNVDTEFLQFLCYKMETPGGTAKPWTNATINAVRQAEEEALRE